ncbi:MAG: hypothetical protein J3K34DRAFT_526024 [Monoraphidium minutum]|nr:MAG: hypothetical protein J3K34DRAFT_526024 [Monoraphidium minutum]
MVEILGVIPRIIPETRDGGVLEAGEEPHRSLDPGQLRRVLNFLGRDGPPKAATPTLRIGILGASQARGACRGGGGGGWGVATYAMIWPARRLPGVQVVGVAARDADRAEAYARQHGLSRSYPSYAALVEDPGLDAVYVALPNGLHGQWAAAALLAGKHVLCEKPFAANADEARRVMAIASARGLLCREAFHNAEHPANKHVAALLQGGAIGDLLSLSARVLIPGWAFKEDDIRFKETLAGGSMMDAGCYCAAALRFFPGLQPTAVTSASAKGILGGCDTGMEARLAYGGPGGGPGQLVGRLEADLRHEGLLPVTLFTAEGTRGRLSYENFVVPFFGHTITVSGPPPEAGAPPAGRTVAVHGSGESNYYYQLSRFAGDAAALLGRGAGGRTESEVRAAMAVDASDALANAELVEAIYGAAGLRQRQPTNTWW